MPTPNLGLTIPVHNAPGTTWEPEIDADLNLIDAAVGANTTAIAAEAVRAEAAETGLATSVATETTRAEGVESTLATKASLATVATSGKYTDLTSLPTLGTAAAHAATDFDANGAASSVQSTLTTALTAEITRAEAAESTLTTAINGKQPTLGFTPENTANKGVANGYASLDSTLHIPINQLPASVQGALSYVGVWNAATNSPAIASGAGTKGNFYKVSVAGSTTVDGNATWHVGDLLIFDGTTWDKIDNYEAVTSVVGQVGAVTLAESDITGLVASLAAKANTASLAPVAISGVYNDLTGKPTLATVAASGSYPDLINKPTLGTAAAMAASAFDAANSAATVQTNLTAEITRAEAAEAGIATSVSDETTRATTAEGLLAPKANPTFTGTVTGITAAMVSALPSSTQLPVTQAATLHKWINSYTSTTGVFTETQPATTDLSDIGTFQLPSSQVTGLPLVSTATPLVNGTAAAGSSGKWADGSHIHPVDTSRQAALGYTPLNPSNNLSDVGAVSTALGNLGGLSSATAASTYAALSGATYTGPVVIPSLSSPTTGTATSSANYNSNTHAFLSSYWTGSAAAVDSWTIQNVLGSGSNPTSVLTISHVGTSGASSVSIAGGVSTPVVTSTVATGTAPFVVASTTPVANLSIPWSGLSGTPSAGFNFSENETPSGLINGVNATYTLAHTPITGSLKLYWNGIRLLQGTHFTLSGSTITMLTGSIPQVNTPVDYLIADYRY